MEKKSKENISHDIHTDTPVDIQSATDVHNSSSESSNTYDIESHDILGRKEFIDHVEQARRGYRHAMIWRRVFMIIFFVSIIAVAAAQPFFHYEWLWEILPCSGFIAVIADGIHASRQRKKQKLAFRKRLYHKLGSLSISAKNSKEELHPDKELDIMESIDSMPTFSIPVADAQVVARHQLAQTRAEHPSVGGKAVEDSLVTPGLEDNSDSANEDIDKRSMRSKNAQSGSKKAPHNESNNVPFAAGEENISLSATSHYQVSDTQEVLLRADIIEQFSAFATKVGVHQRCLDKEFDQYCYEIAKVNTEKTQFNERVSSDVENTNNNTEVSGNKEISDDREISQDVKIFVEEDNIYNVHKKSFLENSKEQGNADRNILWDDSSFFEDIRTKYANDNRLIFFSFGDDSQDSDSSSAQRRSQKRNQCQDTIQEGLVQVGGLLNPPMPSQTSNVIEESVLSVSVDSSLSADMPTSASTGSKKLLQPPVPSIFSLGNENPQPWNQSSAHTQGIHHAQDIHSRTIKSVKQVAKAIPLSVDEQEAIKKSATPSIVSIPVINDSNSMKSSHKKTLNSRTLNAILSQRSQDNLQETE